MDTNENIKYIETNPSENKLLKTKMMTTSKRCEVNRASVSSAGIKKRLLNINHCEHGAAPGLRLKKRLIRFT